MRGKTGLPMFLLAAALFGLIAALATLQYRWLGEISAAERDRMHAAIAADAVSFGESFDQELTRAYLLFEIDPATDQPLAARISGRYDRWAATARFPKMIADVYIVPESQPDRLAHYNPTTRALDPIAWPAALQPIAQHVTPPAPPAPGDTRSVRYVRSLPPPVWAEVPAIVVPIPMILMTHGPGVPVSLSLPPQLSYAILTLDSTYISRTMLPALAEESFQTRGDSGYQLAVVTTTSDRVVFASKDGYAPRVTGPADASVDLFRVRTQDFAPLAAEVGRFAALNAAAPTGDGSHQTIVRETMATFSANSAATGGARPLSIVVQSQGHADSDSVEKFVGTTGDRLFVQSMPHWKLLVQHPSGSLERAVAATRRRNLIVSSSVLGVLGLSVAFLVVSTRRAHDLARQQIEFVATVSHELRTPLAVIRSAADNLADGVVGDEPRVKEYGQLVRREGVRLSELVEQILEFAGLQSGQRALHVEAVAIAPLLQDVVAAASRHAADAGVAIEVSVPAGLPGVAGDPDALRRVFHNLLANAVKYGAAGGWIGIAARPRGDAVEIAISDRGIGIDPGDQLRIFEPFYRAPAVAAAQTQGAGLGLSLVRRIIDAHGGRITVASQLGQGSTFTVTLPAAVERAMPDAAPQVVPSPPVES